jgi:hypothetical protein
LELEKNFLWECIPCLEVTLISRVHPIWCLVA